MRSSSASGWRLVSSWRMRLRARHHAMPKPTAPIPRTFADTSRAPSRKLDGSTNRRLPQQDGPASLRRVRRPLVRRNPHVGVPVPCEPPAAPRRVSNDNKIVTERSMAVPVFLPCCYDAPSATHDVALAVPDRRAGTDDVNRAIDPVRDRNPTTARALHLHRDIDEAIMIKITERNGGVQRGAERKSLIQARRTERAVRPQGHTPERSRRELSTGRRAATNEAGNEECLGRHTHVYAEPPRAVTLGGDFMVGRVD